MNTPDQDTLREDLQSLERHYRSLGNDGPPEMLDQAILNSARRAVELSSARPWSFGWIHATASAALLVLGLTLVLQLRDQLETTPPAPVSPASIDELARDKDGLREPTGGPGPAEARSDHEANSVPASETEAAAGQDNAPVAAKQAMQSDAGETQAGKAEPEAEGILRDRRVVPGGAAPEPSDPSVANESLRQVSGDDLSQAGAERESDEPGRLELRKGAGQAAVEEAPQERAYHASPEAWLNVIENMLKEEKETAWQEELQRFIAAYPDYPLPESLKQALQPADTP